MYCFLRPWNSEIFILQRKETRRHIPGWADVDIPICHAFLSVARQKNKGLLFAPLPHATLTLTKGGSRPVPRPNIGAADVPEHLGKMYRQHCCVSCHQTPCLWELLAELHR